MLSRFAQFILPLELQDRIENTEFRILFIRLFERRIYAFSTGTEYSKQDNMEYRNNMEYRKLNTIYQVIRRRIVRWAAGQNTALSVGNLRGWRTSADLLFVDCL